MPEHGTKSLAQNTREAVDTSTTPEHLNMDRYSPTFLMMSCLRPPPPSPPPALTVTLTLIPPVGMLSTILNEANAAATTHQKLVDRLHLIQRKTDPTLLGQLQQE